MPEVVFAFKDPDRLVYGYPALDHRRVGRGSKDLLATNPLVNARREVVRHDVDITGETTGTKQANRRLGGNSSTDDVFDIRMGFKGVLHQLELDFLAGITVFGFYDLNG